MQSVQSYQFRVKKYQNDVNNVILVSLLLILKRFLLLFRCFHRVSEYRVVSFHLFSSFALHGIFKNHFYAEVCPVEPKLPFSVKMIIVTFRKWSLITSFILQKYQIKYFEPLVVTRRVLWINVHSSIHLSVLPLCYWFFLKKILFGANGPFWVQK